MFLNGSTTYDYFEKVYADRRLSVCLQAVSVTSVCLSSVRPLPAGSESVSETSEASLTQSAASVSYRNASDANYIDGLTIALKVTQIPVIRDNKLFDSFQELPSNAMRAHLESVLSCRLESLATALFTQLNFELV